MNKYYPRFEYRERGGLFPHKLWIDYGDVGLGASEEFDIKPKELEKRINDLDQTINIIRKVTKQLKDEDIIAHKLTELQQEIMGNSQMSCGERLLVQKIFDRLQKELLNGCTIEITHYLTVAKREE